MDDKQHVFQVCPVLCEIRSLFNTYLTTLEIPEIDFYNCTNEGISMINESKPTERLTLVILYISFIYKYKLNKLVFDTEYCKLFTEKWAKIVNRLKPSIFISFVSKE